MTRRSWALFSAMCVIWGIPYLLIRIAVRDLTPGTLVFARTAVGGLVLLPVALARGGFGPVLRRWRPLVAFTAIELAIPWLLLGTAEKQLSSSLSGLLVAAVPLVGVVVARAAGAHDRVGPGRLIGLLLGVGGVATLVGLDLGQLRAGPLAEILVVVVGYAVAPAIMAKRLSDLPSIAVVCASLLLCAIGYLPYAIARPPARLKAETVESILVLALVCTALAFVVFFALIKEIGPARATVITYVNPAVAVLFGIALLGERFTAGMAIGFPLILAGSVLAARRSEVPGGEVSAAALLDDPDDDVKTSPDPAQSSLTSPDAVLNTAASTPASLSTGGDQWTSIPSSGWRDGVPR